MKRKNVGVMSRPRKQIRTLSFDAEPFSNSAQYVEKNGSSSFVSDGFSGEAHGEHSNQGIVPSKKRKRQYRWQRKRKHKHMVGQTDQLINCGGKSCSANDALSGDSEKHIFASNKNKFDCFCCSIFQNVPRMNSNTEIDRRKLFYRLQNSASMFPRKHVLYTLRPNSSGALVLFNNIFGTHDFDKNSEAKPCFHNQISGLVKPSCLYHCLTKLLKKLIRNSQNCPHLRLLEKHCSINTLFHDSSGAAGNDFEENDSPTNVHVSEDDEIHTGKKLSHPTNAKNFEMMSEATAKSNMYEPTKCHCPKKQVVSFIWAICRRIVPAALLGETSNWRILRKNIAKFIQLRKFEKFSLKECIHKLKISKFPLLSKKCSGHVDNGYRAFCVTDAARHAIFECWVFWFFKHVVSPLVQANFYVTETEHGRQEVFYYRKSTWEKLMKEAECMKKNKMYRLLTHASARKILENRQFGFSKARLLPKNTGFRLLANLRAPSKMPMNQPLISHSNPKFHGETFCKPVKYQFFKPVNRVLEHVYVVLKGLFMKERQKMGSSVCDYNDIYRKLVPFLLLLKNGSIDLPNLFIVVADVSKAFDNIHHDKLLSVMEDVVLKDEYALEKLTQVFCTRKPLKVHQQLKLMDQDPVPVSGEIKSFLSNQSLGGVPVKKEWYIKLGKEQIDSLLKEHVKCNIVQFDNNFYLQCVGIPQGSILSTLLCSFYYEHMERNVIFPFFEKVNKAISKKGRSSGTSASADCHTKGATSGAPQHLLLRFVDDYLFISTSKMEASMFYTRLDRGVFEYNCRMNEEKYGLNFTPDKGQPNISKRLYIGKDGVSFLCWSGLLVNCSTLEIQADYTRYLNDHLSSSLTVSCKGNVGCQLKRKLRRYLLTKCHPIFYDSNINSPGVVRLNIYQSFLLCAMKFHCYISKLSILPKFTPKFYFNAITASLRYMSNIIKKKMQSFHSEYDVEIKDVEWLGLYAYSRVLKKKQSQYRVLLGLFASRLRTYGTIEEMSPELRYAVDDTHSSVFWKIKY